MQGIIYIYNTNDDVLIFSKPQNLSDNIYKRDIKKSISNRSYHSDKISKTDDEKAQKEIDQHIRLKNKTILNNNHVIRVYDKVGNQKERKAIEDEFDKESGKDGEDEKNKEDEEDELNRRVEEKLGRRVEAEIRQRIEEEQSQREMERLSVEDDSNRIKKVEQIREYEGQRGRVKYKKRNGTKTKGER
ncbi:unnamed protein product [Rhizophagus irregularis]|uniref:Uncharacterized protein n=1 Tax=Rhizophagus irregularis TaxID=588596 RepID=A0A916EDU2_9GLOM|nr:unnamed protein product [Rhizophagus irregularis]CAB5177008.1 unnamed protein product [Rhizophagus irregularis]CAB5379927.1 unnamed protein product [Rhizophagus irregularis]